MSYDPAAVGGYIDLERIKPITAAWIGDTTAGGTANLQQFADARRFIKARVADIAARDALTGLADGDCVFVKDNGAGAFQVFMWDAAGAGSWKAEAGGGANADTLDGNDSTYFATAADLATLDGRVDAAETTIGGHTTTLGDHENRIADLEAAPGGGGGSMPATNFLATSGGLLNVGSTQTKMNLTAEVRDAEGDFDLANDRFTCVTPGRYAFVLTATGQSQGNEANASASIQIRKNNVVEVSTNSQPTDGNDHAMTVVAHLDLVAGDYVEPWYTFSPDGVGGQMADVSFSGVGVGGGGSSSAAFAQPFGMGPLDAMAGLTAGFDWHVSDRARTLGKLAFSVNRTPGTGSIVLDVRKNGTTLFPTEPKPTLTCNGGRVKGTLSGAGLETVAIAANDEITFHVVSAPSGCYDVRMEAYE